MVDWANLEAYPLSLVLDKLEEHIDHVRFGVVCKSWLSVANINHKNYQFRIKVPPMLMILLEKLSRRQEKSMRKKRLLYSILSEKDYPIRLPHPSIYKSKRCLGCSHGWLALVDDNNVITLMNPFKRSIAPIRLPPLESLKKVTLSADPMTNPSDYVVAAIYRFGYLAFKRPSQSFWIRVDSNEFYFTDVVFYKGLVFADSTDTIVSFKFNNPRCDDSYIFPDQCYFMKSLTRDVWMVRKCSIDKHSFKHHVYKLDLDVQSGRLEQISRLNSLEDNILFIKYGGDSLSVSASCFSTLEKDSIYLISKSGLRIENVKDGSFHIRSLPISFNWMKLFWVLPQFQWD